MSGSRRPPISILTAALLLWLLPATTWAEGQATPSAPAETPQDQEVTPGAALPWASLRVGVIVLYDYTWFSQDNASIDQVGFQENQGEFRADRISLVGTLFNRRSRPWSYVVAFEYRGFDGEEGNDWSFFDYALKVPAGPLGSLSIGKMKEAFSYEMVGDSAFLPHSERILSPFFASRSVGVRLNKVLPGNRATVAVGAFNDWFVKDLSYSDSGWDVTARVTGVPMWSREGRRFLHLGGAWRYQGADQGVLRYKGQPESHVSDNFVDTGDIPASHANHFGAEALWNEGPVSILGEYITAQVSSREADDPSFSGGYLTVSWVLTGETRPYDRNVGYARKVVPARRWGAIELIGRYSVVDVNDRAIDGGDLGKWLASVSYYPTRRMRISVATGRTTLDRSGLTGKTTQTLARVQWIY